MADHRAVFDFRITFTNGGEISGRDFRLDVPGPDVDAAAAGLLLVGHLGLLMVDCVELDPFRVVEEPHRGGRGVEVEAATARRIVDLSHPIRAGMVTYPGLPGPETTDHLTHAAADLAATGLDHFVDLEAVVVRVAGSPVRPVDAAQLAPYDVGGRAVLVHTGWDRHWATPAYTRDNPYVTQAAARWLAGQGAALVAIDSVDIDDVDDRSRPAHSVLLAAGIPMVEHLCGLDGLPPQGFRFHAAPPASEGLGTFPVRAYAVVEAT
jgi:kynurenine formamidase